MRIQHLRNWTEHVETSHKEGGEKLKSTLGNVIFPDKGWSTMVGRWSVILNLFKRGVRPFPIRLGLQCVRLGAPRRRDTRLTAKKSFQSLPRHFTGNSNSMGSSSIFLFWVALKRNVRPIFNSKSFALSIVYALLTILLSSSQKHHGHYIPIGRTSQLHYNAVQQHSIIKRQGSQKAAIFSLEVQSLDVI